MPVVLTIFTSNNILTNTTKYFKARSTHILLYLITLFCGFAVNVFLPMSSNCSLLLLLGKRVKNHICVLKYFEKEDFPVCLFESFSAFLMAFAQPTSKQNRKKPVQVKHDLIGVAPTACLSTHLPYEAQAHMNVFFRNKCVPRYSLNSSRP